MGKMYRYKKKPTTKSAKTIAKIAKKVVKRALDNRNQLNYWHVNSATFIDMDENPTAIALSDVTQEAGAASDVVRTGDEIRVRKISLRLALAFATGSANPSICRVLLIQFKNDNGGSVPTLDDVLQTVADGEGVLSTYAQDELRSGTFKVVLDRTYAMSGGSAGGRIVTYSTSTNFIKKITYNAASASSGANLFYLYLIGDTSTVANQAHAKYDWIMHFEP